MDRRWLRLSLAALALPAALVARAQPTNLLKINYLIAAPSTLPSFGPYIVAQNKGYYRDAGLEVNFIVAAGGAEVAKQIGAGNADMGGGIGDTPIILRQHGLKVRGVALLGGRSLTQIVVRKDAGVRKLSDLRGKTIVVQSYQDTTYYTLLGVLAKVGLSKQDVVIHAVGPAGISQLVATGNAAALAGTPDRGILVEETGVPVDWYNADDYFPAMAPAILASDSAINARPQVIRAFVQATLHGLRDVMADPVKAASVFLATASDQSRQKEVEAVFTAYDQRVYPGQTVLGAFDEKRLSRLQDDYFDAGIIQSRSPVPELYTNSFIEQP